VLFIAFALGVWGAASRKRALRFIGGLLVGLGVINFVAIFTPEHLGEAAATLANTIHITLAGVTSLLILLQIGSGAFAFGKRFRLYSVGTLLTLLVVGALAGQSGAQIVAGQPTPWFGVTERILIYGYMLWVAVLAVVLLQAEKGANWKASRNSIRI
jgi:preprotein translocase subunit SecG